MIGNPLLPLRSSHVKSMERNSIFGIHRDNLKIAAFVLIWYFASSLSNNTNKQILTLLPRPMLLTMSQLVFVFIFCAIYLSIQNKFRIFPRHLLLAILPLAFANFFSHFLAYMALKDIPVSFIHTIKATSPIFTVVLSAIFLKKRYSLSLLITLVPVVIGVTICTFSEIASLGGILVTLLSTLVLVSQNLYSKHLFQTEKVHQIVLVMNVAGTAAIANLPLFLYFDFFADSFAVSLSEVSGGVLMNLVLNGFFHFIQNVMAFTLLSMVTPISYSVANTLKRVFVIIISILYFKNPISLSNVIGIAIALTGIFLYNQARVKEAKKMAKKLEKTYIV